LPLFGGAKATVPQADVAARGQPQGRRDPRPAQAHTVNLSLIQPPMRRPLMPGPLPL
jgi:hypothetical protein